MEGEALNTNLCDLMTLISMLEESVKKVRTFFYGFLFFNYRDPPHKGVKCKLLASEGGKVRIELHTKERSIINCCLDCMPKAFFYDDEEEGGESVTLMDATRGGKWGHRGNIIQDRDKVRGGEVHDLCDLLWIKLKFLEDNNLELPV
jgi:hypothetical protein